jgi:hypothetical protein
LLRASPSKLSRLSEVQPLAQSLPISALSAERGAGACSEPPHLSSLSDAKVANRDGRDFGWEVAHAAVSRRPQPRRDGTLYRGLRVRRWGLGIIQAFSVAPCQTLKSRVATFASLYAGAWEKKPARKQHSAPTAPKTLVVGVGFPGWRLCRRRRHCVCRYVALAATPPGEADSAAVFRCDPGTPLV